MPYGVLIRSEHLIGLKDRYHAAQVMPTLKSKNPSAYAEGSISYYFCLLEVEVDAYATAGNTGVDTEVELLGAAINRGGNHAGTVPCLARVARVSRAAEHEPPSVLTAQAHLRSAEPLNAYESAYTETEGATTFRLSNATRHRVVSACCVTILILRVAATESQVSLSTINTHNAGATNTILHANAQHQVELAVLRHVINERTGSCVRVRARNQIGVLLVAETDAHLSAQCLVGSRQLLALDREPWVRPRQATSNVVTGGAVEQVSTVVEQWISIECEAPIAVLGQPILTLSGSDLAGLGDSSRAKECCGEQYSLSHVERFGLTCCDLILGLWYSDQK